MGTFAAPIRAGARTTQARSPVHEYAPYLHGLLLAVAFIVFARSIALASGIVAGASAAVAGAVLASRLVRARYRLPVILGLSAIVSGGGYALLGLLRASHIFASAVGPTASLHLQDALRWAVLAFGGALGLRATAIRFRAALAIEGSVVVAAVAATVAAHRDGMIARPLEVSDWFWSQGVDPVVAFLAVGLVGGTLLAAVLAYGRSGARTVLQLLAVLMVGLYFASQIHSHDPVARKNAAGGKLQNDEDESAKHQQVGGGGGGDGGQGQRQAKQDQSQSPFQDGMPKPGQNDSPKNRPAAIVVFHKDTSPATGVFYFRHASFSQFNGVRLIETTRPGIDQDTPHGFPTEREDVPGVPGDDSSGSTRTLVATDVALLTPHTRMFALIDPVEAAPRANPAPARFVRAYSVLSSVLTRPYSELIGGRAGNREWSDEVWEHYTIIPKDDRYHTLAASLQSNLRSEYSSDPVALAMAVKQYLEQTATYSFARDYEGETDPTAAFLFSEDKKGYCVHLAHAASYLLRSMGVPTRVSAGYAVVGENLGGGSSLLIKEGDAHAWAEIYLEGVGWVPIEVTPEKSEVPTTPFNERDLQQLLGEMAREEGKETRQAPETPRVLEALKAIARLIPALLLAVLAAAYVFKTWRLVAPAVVSLQRRPRIAYRAALDRLSAVGQVREIGESRERFAERVRALSPSFSPLTSVHVGAAMGSRAVRSSERDFGELSTLSGGVGREVRQSVPWWRWLLGALNPISWLWSR